MKYRIISDIHSEFWDENPAKAVRLIEALLPPLADDKDATLLLAGDTGSFKRKNIYAAVISHLCKRFPSVFDIPGNHFWYGQTPFEQILPPIATKNYNFGDYYARNSIIAATLWTNFNNEDPLAELACRSYMNDYRQSPGLTTEAVKALHKQHLNFIRQSAFPGDIIMTHHAPSYRSVPERFKSSRHDNINHGYASALDHIIEDMKPALWIHGHIHDACDYTIGSTRIICNPAGYPDESTGYNPTLLVEA